MWHFTVSRDQVRNDVKYSESSRPEVFYKKVFLKILQIHRKTPVPESLFK